MTPYKGSIGNSYWTLRWTQTIQNLNTLVELAKCNERQSHDSNQRFVVTTCCLMVPYKDNIGNSYWTLCEMQTVQFWVLVDPMNANHAIRISDSMVQFSCLIARDKRCQVDCLTKVSWRNRHVLKPCSHCMNCSLRMDSCRFFGLLGVKMWHPQRHLIWLISPSNHTMKGKRNFEGKSPENKAQYAPVFSMIHLSIVVKAGSSRSTQQFCNPLFVRKSSHQWR